MSATQTELSASPLSRGSFHVPPGEWARRGLVDAAFVARSVAVLRDRSDAEQQLRAAMERTLGRIRAIDLACGDEMNEWATTARERLWLEHFTAEEILRRLKSAKASNEVKR